MRIVRRVCLEPSPRDFTLSLFLREDKTKLCALCALPLHLWTSPEQRGLPGGSGNAFFGS